MSILQISSKNIQRVVSVVVILCMTISLLSSSLVLAAGNQLYITPSSSQMNINTTFSVNVRSYAESWQSTGSANGTVTYPANLLQVTGISTAGSGYGSPSISQSSGAINFSASRSPADSGAAQIFSITFRAVNAGTAAVGFGGNSKVNDTTTAYSSGVYTIINPSPPPSSSPPPPPSSTPKPSVTPVPIQTTPTPTPQIDDLENPQPTPDPTGLIDNVIIDPLYDASTISWKVNASNPKATLSYGSKASTLDQQAAVTQKTDGTFNTVIKGLSPGVRYYFAISGNGDGGKSGAYSGTIITRGFPITVTVTENNIVVKNAQVKIGSRSYTTTSNGKLSIGLAAGSYSGTITTDTASLTINLTVETKSIPTDGTAPPSQSFAYNLTSSPLEQGPGSELSILAFIGVLLGGTVLLGLGFVGFMAYRRRKFESADSYSASSAPPTVIIDDGYSWQQDTVKQQDTQGSNTPPTPAQLTREHHNSVYIDEAEPPDMFEQPGKAPTPPKRPPN